MGSNLENNSREFWVVFDMDRGHEKNIHRVLVVPARDGREFGLIILVLLLCCEEDSVERRNLECIVMVGHRFIGWK